MRPVVHHNNNYSPVVSWDSIRILLSTIILNTWKMMHLDYVLYFTQYLIKKERYMNIPKVIEVKSYIEWVLKFKSNTYRKLQADRVCNLLLLLIDRFP